MRLNGVVHEELRERRPDGSTSTTVHRLDRMPEIKGLLDMDTFAKMSQVTAAFSTRDLQVAQTIHYWLQYNGLSVETVPLFILTREFYTALSSMSYFSPSPSIEHAKVLKRFESSLPKKTRIQLRKVRLKYTREGHSGHG